MLKDMLYVYKKNEPSIKNYELVAKYGIGISTCSKILAKSDYWLSIDPNSNKATYKRSKVPVFMEIESAVALWTKYRCFLIQNWLDIYEFAHNNQTKIEAVNIKEAIEYFELDHNDLPQEDTSLYNEYLDDENKVDYLIEQLPINTNDLLSTSEYIKIDNDLSTTEIPLNQEILAALQEDDGDDTSEPLIQILLKTALEIPTVVTDFPTTIATAAINSYNINETFRYEAKSIKTKILPVISHHNRLNQEEMQTNIKLILQRRVYSIHAPLRYMIEQNIVFK
ncbi:12499_t:CDS:2, partial [Racocetra persica]